MANISHRFYSGAFLYSHKIWGNHFFIFFGDTAVVVINHFHQHEGRRINKQITSYPFPLPCRFSAFLISTNPQTTTHHNADSKGFKGIHRPCAVSHGVAHVGVSKRWEFLVYSSPRRSASLMYERRYIHGLVG